jgi:hypothetical protein
VALPANVLLGLMTKLEQLFASDGVFLSFPPDVVAFPKAHLAALAEPSSSTDAVRAAADFARVVNTIPRGRLWQMDDSRPLWDVLGEILESAEVAEAHPDAAVSSGFEEATALLFETLPDGSKVESDTLLKYREFRDATFVARAELNNRRGHAALSDETTQAEFTNVEEPALLAAIADIEQNWNVIGRKADVEAAQAAIGTYYRRDPAVAWSAFEDRFDPDPAGVTLLTGPNGPYAPTGLLPATVADAEWASIALDRTELEALARDATDELRARLEGKADPSMTEVNFEYTSAGIQRAWWSPELVEARYWRLPAGIEPLSDGGDPPSGSCVAYVAAVALARKIVIVRSVAGDRSESDRTPMTFQPRIVASVATRRPRAAAGGDVRDHRTGRVHDNRTKETRQRRTARVRERRVIVRPISHQTRTRLLPAILTKPVLTARVQAPAEQTERDQSDEGQVYILAFICRRLPRSPDPDPELFGAE